MSVVELIATGSLVVGDNTDHRQEILWTYPDKSIGAVGRDELAIFFSKATRSIEPNIHWIFAENIDLTCAEFKSRGADII